MRFLILSIETRSYVKMIFDEFPDNKKQHIKSFHGAKPKAPLEM